MENEKNMAMPEFTNKEVEKAIKQFLDEKSNENMANLMQAMRDTRFLVPADFPPDIKKQVIEKAYVVLFSHQSSPHVLLFRSPAF